MYLLDTNHCSYILEEQPNVLATLQQRADSAIGVNIITYSELLYMAEKSEQPAENIEIIQAFLAEIDLYFIDEETAIIHSHLKLAVFNYFGPKDKQKRRKMTPANLGFSDHDLWIASTAIQHIAVFN